VIVASIPNIDLPLNGVFDTIFRQTWVQVSVLGAPSGGYKITLIDLIILALLALAVNGLTERLTSKKLGSMATAIVITIVGSILVVTFVNLPFDFAIEGLRVIAALLGSLVISVFYVLLRGQSSASAKK
jgi:uncharacterized protein YqgC (DUF456 family)